MAWVKGWGGGVGGARVGSGVCGNQKCWQLRGKWQSGVGGFGLGFYFRRGDCPSLTPPQSDGASLFPRSRHPSRSSAMLSESCYGILGGESWGGSGRRGEVSPLCPFLRCLLGSVLLGFHSPLGFSAPSCFFLLSFPASFPLPAAVADPLSHPSLQAAG